VPVSHFSISVKTVEDNYPFSITFKSESQTEVNKLISDTPDIVRAFIADHQLRIQFTKQKIQG